MVSNSSFAALDFGFSRRVARGPSRILLRWLAPDASRAFS
jgi:hypothetical protein